MKRIRIVLCLILGALSCSCSAATAPRATESARLGELRVTFFDAGKADCFLLQTDSSVVLIDCGTNKFGKQLVSYLEEQGLDHIDAMFITHFDKDHVGGADAVLDNLTVDTVYEPDYAGDGKQYRQYRDALENSSATLETLRENITFSLDSAVYDVDVANETFYGEDEENDFSLVVSIRYGSVSFLFAGDAENPRLSELLAEGVQPHTVLKVPHHGRLEELSGEFFAQTAPRYAVITSDEENREDPEVVSLLEELGARVFLTRNGTVECVTDGTRVSFRQEQA